MHPITIPANVPARAHATFVVGFGDAVREYVSNGDVDVEQAAREAENWTSSDAYRVGFSCGAIWAAQS